MKQPAKIASVGMQTLANKVEWAAKGVFGIRGPCPDTNRADRLAVMIPTRPSPWPSTYVILKRFSRRVR